MTDISAIELLDIMREALCHATLDSGQEITYLDGDMMMARVADKISNELVNDLEPVLVGIHVTEAAQALQGAENEGLLPIFAAPRVWAARVNGKWNRDFLAMLRERAKTEPAGIQNALGESDPPDWVVKRFRKPGDVLVRLNTSGVIAEVEGVFLG